MTKPAADVVLGVDSSTQSTKVQARSLHDGSLVAVGAAGHASTTPPISEQDPRSWWDALARAVLDVPPDVRRRVGAISVAGQQHGLVVLDDADRPVRPAKLWNDTTSAPQATRLVERFGALQWADAVGVLPVAAITITKLAWMVEHEPQLVERIARIMLPHDYLTMRLCGRAVTDRGDASGTGWFDATHDRYRPDVLDLIGVSGSEWLDKLPAVLQPHDVAGRILDSVASELGLSSAVRVGAGTGDNMAGALGLGLDTGDVALSLGTSGVAYARSATPTADSSGIVAGFADATGGFLPLVCTLNATKVTDAVGRWLGAGPAELARLALDADSDGLTVVPWFDGERTPNRPMASGTILGLRTDTTREQIARAAFDGVLCGLLAGVDALGACAVDVSGRLHLIGGGARSAAYRQRCADLWQRAIHVPHDDEIVAVGAATQAAAILGNDTLSAVSERWQLGSGTTVEPQESAARAQDIRRRYRNAVAVSELGGVGAGD